jgi:hypothetical protein
MSGRVYLTVKTDQSVERGEKATSSDLGFAEALAGVGPEKRKEEEGREGPQKRGAGRQKKGYSPPDD